MTDPSRAAVIARLTQAKAQVLAIVNSIRTPLSGHNDNSRCDWCLVTWTKPDWRLDPQPPLFGHPENECLVWLAVSDLTLLSAQESAGTPTTAEETRVGDTQYAAPLATAPTHEAIRALKRRDHVFGHKCVFVDELESALSSVGTGPDLRAWVQHTRECESSIPGTATMGWLEGDERFCSCGLSAAKGIHLREEFDDD